MSQLTPNEPFERSLPMLLVRAREALLEPVRPILRSHGLTDQQWRVLRVLYQVREMEMARLAQAAFLRPPSLTRIIRDLVDRDLVSRRVDADDRRVMVLALAPAGRELLDAALPAIRTLGAQVRARIGGRQADELKVLLLALLDATGEPEL